MEDAMIIAPINLTFGSESASFEGTLMIVPTSSRVVLSIVKPGVLVSAPLTPDQARALAIDLLIAAPLDVVHPT
jgi:hypothetical protein